MKMVNKKNKTKTKTNLDEEGAESVQKDILNTIIEKKNSIEKDITQELVNTVSNTPRQIADIAIKILHENFGTRFDILQKKGTLKYHISRKGTIVQLTGNIVPEVGKTILGEGQMIFDIRKDGKIDIRLNPDGNGYICYHAQGLSNHDFIGEISILKSFLSDGTIPSSTSKFKKENFSSDLNQEDIDELLAGYTDI